MSSNEDNTGIAFALVLGAGASTALGAGVVFVPRLVKLASRKTLAAALGLSAGVMTYVSFVEIFQKSNDSFLDAGKDEDVAQALATVCFFGGVVCMIILNHLVTKLLGGHHHHSHDVPVGDNLDETRKTQRCSHEEEPHGSVCDKDESLHPHCPCCAEDPVKDLSRVHDMVQEIEDYELHEHRHWDGRHHSYEDEQQHQQPVAETPSDISDEQPATTQTDPSHPHKLMRMSMNTALAITIHNFPEGLATFVAALRDVRVGVVLAVAIAIHNIPEGLCVAMPIYYATGNKWKAFMWAVLSGVSEPVAALLGWAVLASSFSDAMYASLFGVVSGMMVIISVRELLPTAHRYDPEDSVVTYSFIGGMMIMALSLVLFAI